MNNEKPLSKEEQNILLEYARHCVESHVLKQEIHTLDDPRFQDMGAVFVTIHRKGELRGCIGRFAWDTPLTFAIQEMAIHAATQDPRFLPISKDELSLLSFEISVLSPPVVVQDINEIEIGVHGLIISMGMKRGVLLPQVASERAWTVQEFLENTCQKANLPKNAWEKDNCEILSFKASVFSDTPTSKK